MWGVFGRAFNPTMVAMLPSFILPQVPWLVTAYNLKVNETMLACYCC